MDNPLKQIIKQYLNFSRSDRNAILILSALILIVIIANIIIKNREQKPSSDSQEYRRIINEWDNVVADKDYHAQSLFPFNPNTISESKLDSLQISVFIKGNLLNYRKAGGRFSSAKDFRKIYGVNDSIYNVLESFIKIEKGDLLQKSVEIKALKEVKGYFDPNKANLDILKKFGFNNFQANNLLSFRKKGGVIKKPRDLRKIYGVDSLFYSTIKNNIKIEKVIYSLPEEIKDVSTNIELNNVDSMGLVKLKGIGPVYAKRIIKYRNLLGGFHSKEQLLEVYNFPEETFHEIKNHISVDTILIRKIRINFAEYSDLLRHPYLNKNQVEGIINFRKRNGSFEEISQIQSIEMFDEKIFTKIRHYLTCR